MFLVQDASSISNVLPILFFKRYRHILPFGKLARCLKILVGQLYTTSCLYCKLLYALKDSLAQRVKEHLRHRNWPQAA